MVIYTDGACTQKEGIGGWAFLILEQRGKSDYEISFYDSGGEMEATNQRMEIKAVSMSLRSIKDYKIESLTLYSDSAYVINCLNDRWFIKWELNGWKNSKGEDVKNREEWEELISLYREREIVMNIFHIKRATTEYIKIVDSMAKDAKGIASFS